MIGTTATTRTSSTRTQSGIKLPRAWKQLFYHEQQQDIIQGARTGRYKRVYLECGRGSGKTEIAQRHLVRQLAAPTKMGNPIYFYVLPTINQAKKVAWRPILDLIPKDWIIRKNEMELYIRTIFGSELYVGGGDQPKRLEGRQYQGGIIDEASDQKPELWTLSLGPAMTVRQDTWLWKIGVPKRIGVGARAFQEEFDLIAEGDIPFSVAYNWESEGIVEKLNPGILEQKRRELDQKDYDEQYRAKRVTAGGAIFYGFDKNHNVTEEGTEYRSDLPLCVCMDFNVDPMSWVLGHRIGDSFFVFDEIFIRDTNTPEALSVLFERYGNHNEAIHFFGDAASRQRTSNTSISNYVIINNWEFRNKVIHIPPVNPAIADRFAATNAVICNADNKRRLFVNPRCKYLIRDLTYRGYKKGTNLPDDRDPDAGHMTDALGYYLWIDFPMPIENLSQPGRIYISKSA